MYCFCEQPSGNNRKVEHNTLSDVLEKMSLQREMEENEFLKKVHLEIILNLRQKIRIIQASDGFFSNGQTYNNTITE